MKRFLLSLIIVFYPLYLVYSSDFNTTPIGMNFNGVVISGHNIIAYSDNGNYFMTTDKGLSWKQYSINDNGNIKKMINHNDTLWGVIDIGLIIQSTDNGFTWTKHKYQLDSADVFNYIAVSSNYLYIRCHRKIIQFDKSLNYKNAFIDTALYCDKSSMNKENFKYMGIYNNNYIVVSVSNEVYDKNGYLLILNEDLKITKKVLLSDYLTCKDDIICLGYDVRNEFEYFGKKVCIIKYLPFIAEDDYTKWAYLFADTSEARNNHTNDTNYLLYTTYINNNKIYMGVCILDNPHKYHKGKQASSTIWNLGVLNYNTETEHLELLGNLYKTNYYTIGNTIYSDGISQSLWHESFVVFEDSIIVWAGLNKTIFQSRDKGNSWELISFFNDATPSNIINDSLSYFIKNTARHGEMLHTFNNSNNTFLPAGYQDTMAYFIDFHTSHKLHIDSLGRGFTTGAVYFAVYDKKTFDNNIGVTIDSGKTFKFLTKENLYTDYPADFSDVKQISDKALFTLYKTDSCITYRLDMNTFELELLNKEYKNRTYYLFGNKIDNFYSVTYFKNTAFPDSNRIEIRETKDSGKNWLPLNTIYKTMNINQVYEHNQDSIFIVSMLANNNRIYLYNKQTNIIDTLYANNSRTFTNLQVMCVSNKFFIVGDKLFLENTNRNDLSKWTEAKWDYGTPSFNYVLFKNNIAFARLSDSIRPQNIYKLTIKDDNTGIRIEETENKANNHFYAGSSYPIPANNISRTKVYWDDNYDIENADKKVYDINGNQVKINNIISITNKLPYSAELVFDCSSLASGVYFIILDHNGVNRSIPVLIAR